MDAFIGEIRAFPYTYVPYGWLQCSGGTVQVLQYQALYALIGNTFGGTQGQTFGLPDLRGLMIIGAGVINGTGTNYLWSVTGGAPSVTLNSSQMVPHTHTFQGATSTVATQEVNQPTAASYLSRVYAKASAAATTGVSGHGFASTSDGHYLNSGALSIYPGTGGAHSNLMPSVGMQFCIAWSGEWPSPN